MNTDYLIIGGGTAGCVLARRLLDKLDCRVTVLEAGGPDDEPAIHRTDLASVVSMVDDPELARRYETAPQPGLGGRSVTIAQARVLGGGSSINATMYVRGDRHDFDHWRELGNDGWGYRDVLPYFATAEHYAGGGDPVYRGSDGPLHVTPYHQPSAASLAFLDAASELGYGQPATDYNAGRLAGTACLYQSTRTKDDRRCSTAVAYLHPVLPDPRLSVHVGAVATRILLRDGRATGAEFIRDGQVTQVYADREVIVASGALASPKLLMLSGIGPAEALREHGIVPAVDLPGVGRNLHDHLLYGVAYQSRRPLPPPRLLAEAGLFTHSRTGAEGEPDLQFFFGPVFYAAERYRVAGPAFTAAPILLSPRSRGTVSLRSADPADPPVVDPDYLSHAADLATLVRGAEIARELIHSAAFAELRGPELAPGARVSDAEGLAHYVRQSADTLRHPVGTCKLGTDPDAVVDPRLLVHGVDRLRVVDASVMPTITRGGTNAPTIMIAEKAADLIATAG